MRASETRFVFFSSRRRHTRYWRGWSSDVCSSDLGGSPARPGRAGLPGRAVPLPRLVHGRRAARAAPGAHGLAGRGGGDRESGVGGKGGGLGGLRIIKKKN